MDNYQEEDYYSIILNGKIYNVSARKLKEFHEINSLELTDQDKASIFGAIKSMPVNMRHSLKQDVIYININSKQDTYVTMYPPEQPKQITSDHLQPLANENIENHLRCNTVYNIELARNEQTRVETPEVSSRPLPFKKPKRIFKKEENKWKKIVGWSIFAIISLAAIIGSTFLVDFLWL